MESQHFTFKEATLCFQKYGNGPKTLLAFHGFSQNHTVFEKLPQVFDNLFTVISFDLFFHGKSLWGYNEAPIEKDFWKELMNEFIRVQSIDRFSLIGFSIGAKFALATLESFPEQIETLHLLAPDGVRTNLWYQAATYPVLLRNFFKSMIDHPNRFEAITRLAHGLGWIDKIVVRFVQSQMDTEFKRMQVYYSWVVFRHLKFKQNKIASLLNLHHIQTTVVIGRHDKIIKIKNLNTFLKRLNNKTLVIVETGHPDLINQWVRSLKK